MWSDPADTPELHAARAFSMSHLRAWATKAHEERRRLRAALLL